MNVWIEFAIAMTGVFALMLLTFAWRARERAASSRAQIATESDDVRYPASVR